MSRSEYRSFQGSDGNADLSQLTKRARAATVGYIPQGYRSPQNGDEIEPDMDELEQEYAEIRSQLRHAPGTLTQKGEPRVRVVNKPQAEVHAELEKKYRDRDKRYAICKGAGCYYFKPQTNLKYVKCHLEQWNDTGTNSGKVQFKTRESRLVADSRLER